MQKIAPCLWFDKQAEEAAKFYVKTFKKSKIVSVVRAPADYPGNKKGSVLVVYFKLEGRDFIALNGGPYHKFNEAVSLSVDCKTQAEVNSLTRKLTAGGGKIVQCSWVKDKYGLSWQVVPSIMPKMLADRNPERAKRVFLAMSSMKVINIDKIKKAYKGK